MSTAVVPAPAPALAPAAPALPSEELTCRAPHRDPKKPGEPCGRSLGFHLGAYEFVTTAERRPAEPDGFAWVQCPHQRCGLWNKFRLVPLPPPDPQAALQERLASLRPEQQIGVYALAGGISVGVVARQLGVDRRTVFRWKKEDAVFGSVLRELGPILSEAHTRAATEALFDVIEKDRKKGVAHNARWYLSRTVFAQFEQLRAAAGGTAVNVNLQQIQQNNAGHLQRIWEERRAGARVAGPE